MPSRTSKRRRSAGLDVDSFGQRLSFFFNAHNDFLEEVAKFRAARRLWARSCAIGSGATTRARSSFASIPRRRQHAHRPAARQQRRRVAIQALAAVLGGTQSLHCNGLDEALALPTEAAARTALRTQQVIAHETGVVNSVDPLAGAWAVEAATNRIEQEAVAMIERIDAAGGTSPRSSRD
jgi:methylmalonyl-CoA mutase N-terminal domain/subunit